MNKNSLFSVPEREIETPIENYISIEEKQKCLLVCSSTPSKVGALRSKKFAKLKRRPL